MLADNTRQWNKILLGMKNWEEDDVITDYISNPVLNLIAELGSGNVTEELCQNLHLKIESAKQNIENEVEDYSEQRREIGKELKEKALQSMGFYDENNMLANGAVLFQDDYQGKKTEVKCSVFSGFNKGSEKIITINRYNGNITSSINYMMDFVNQRMNHSLIKLDNVRKKYRRISTKSTI